MSVYSADTVNGFVDLEVVVGGEGTGREIGVERGVIEERRGKERKRGFE